jgi:hypothetical protein
LRDESNEPVGQKRNSGIHAEQTGHGKPVPGNDNFLSFRHFKVFAKIVLDIRGSYEHIMRLLFS